jgi:hypothetical protein
MFSHFEALDNIKLAAQVEVLRDILPPEKRPIHE